MMQQVPADVPRRPVAIEDRAVARALDLIHAHYAEPLTVAQLAREAGVSRTVLGERFGRVIGESPMRYAGRWRLKVAAERLASTPERSSTVGFSVGFGSEEAFSRAFRREFGLPPSAWRKQAAARDHALPRQHIHAARAADGTRLAWAEAGSGPPLLKTANWLNHLSFDWESPVWRHWLAELTREHRLVRYDERGNGLSDWNVERLDLEAFVDDMETVVDAAGLEQFDLLAISQGAAVAIAYSVRHPGRIRRMVLIGGYALGWAQRLSGEELERREAMVTLSGTGWGSDNPAFRQLFTSLYIPGGTPEQLAWFNELQRISTSPANAVRLQRALGQIDIRGLLPQVTVPTLVLHARGDSVIPFEVGEHLAANIPGAGFVELDSANHVLLADEPAWPVFVAAMRDFLAS